MGITLDKAMKNLKAARTDCGMIPEEEFTPTMDLAYEALKWIKRDRDRLMPGTANLLPGETEK